MTDWPAQLRTGRPQPLGAHWDGAGVNFAVFSANAQQIEVCVFDEETGRELQRWPLPGRNRDVWHGYLPGAAPGLLYGLYAHGSWQPAIGQRFDGTRLLLDPWAREIVGRSEGHQAPRARVVHDDYDWREDRRPAHSREDLVLYELHVKGFTQRHPDVPPLLRGSYAGLAQPASIAYLQRLGITAVSLLPVHQHHDEPYLQARGLINHWGYNTLGYFCPEPRYAAAAATGRAVRDEFRDMVRTLHAAGIEPEPDFDDENSRKLRFATNDPGLEIIRVRCFDVATFVAFGAAHLGIAGSDVLEEFDYPEIYAPLDLRIGLCHLGLARREGVKSDALVKRSHIRVATKYPNITRRFFADQGIQAECVKLSGAIELAPLLGLTSHIVDLVSTGNTLRSNGLEETTRILEVSSRLIVNRTAFKTRSVELTTIIDHCRQAVESTHAE